VTATDGPDRLPLLKSLRDLAKAGAKLDASIVTTFAFNGLFYEEVLLRAFERAGSRLNIVLVDAAQLVESMNDPLRRPSRAGVDYLLAPITHRGAFHPKIVALLSEKQPLLALGSHNVTDAGYSHNEELTSFWGLEHLPPLGVLRDAVDYAVGWLRVAEAVPGPVLDDITKRLQSLVPVMSDVANEEVTFIGSRAGACLWDQLRSKVVGNARRVSVIGPYFDADMALLRAIDAALHPAEILVGIQPNTAVLPRPDLAPQSVRFIDASALNAFWPKLDEVGFAHGKAIAIETANGLVMSLGSANPTGAAWLQKAAWNAEANLCLIGESAGAAFESLGLNRLNGAPALEAPVLREIAERSQKLRRQEQTPEKAKGPALIIGRIVEGGISLPGFRLDEPTELRLVGVVEGERAVAAAEIEGGSLLRFIEGHPTGGVHQLQSHSATVAFVVVNDDQALRTASLPRESARILDHLGALDNSAGFIELLDLLDKHVLSPSEAFGARASRPHSERTEEGQTTDEEAPFGPRGISLPQEAESATQRPRLNDGLIADIISALIRALGAAPSPETDGDAPDLDEGDALDEPSSGQLARNLDAEPQRSEIDWPRLVTACRKRLTLMIRRLEVRMFEAAAGDHSPSWALGRLVVVLSLLRRLRIHPPQAIKALNGRLRPLSLVSLEQLREVLRVAVCALYGQGTLALKLEMTRGTRVAEERQLIDNLLFWFAREVGADSRREPKEKPTPALLQARADLIPIIMSATAYPKLESWAEYRDPWLSIWDDSLVIQSDWASRQLKLGSVFQRLRRTPLLPSAKTAMIGDLVRWQGERDLPWVVASVSGRKAVLIEPAGSLGIEKKVLLNSIAALDVEALIREAMQDVA